MSLQEPKGLVTYLHGIRVQFDEWATSCPVELPALAAELALVYGTDKVAGYYQPMIHVLEANEDGHARIGVATARTYVAPIQTAQVAEAIRVMRSETLWIPSVAP